MKLIRTLIVMVAVSAIVTISSCGTKSSPVNGKIKSTTVSTTGGGTTTTNFTYDSQGRLLAAQTTAGTTTYTYSASNVTVLDVSGTTTIYTLNNQNYAGSDNNGFTYTYDNSGFLITESLTGVGSATFTINNGDISNATIITTGTTTVLYSYMSNLDYRDNGLSFMGRKSTHVLSSTTQTSGSSSTTYTYAYNFDSQGRVITETKTGNSTITTTTYTYTS